ncbi:sigma-54 interaction domain-containing protein [Thermodesulfobacteriota bacterium]
MDMKRSSRETANRGKVREAGTERPLDKKDILRQLEMYRLILDSIHNGCIITDGQGYITHFNKPYGLFLGLDPEEQIGKHCTEVIQNTRMHIVARTGEAEINQSHRIRDQDMVVQRIPIKKNGEVLAVFGQVMFKDKREVGKLAEKLSVMESKVEFYEQELMSLRSTRYTIDSIVGVSDAVKIIKGEALRAASNNLPVLITGESGTGKELFAQAIHHASSRKLHPFIRINCSAIPKDLLESELFGYEKGAFTGARSEGKPGKFELAHHGSILLDEIGDLPLEMQPKLLRVLEEKEFERVGGNDIIRSDFRLIAASNQSLDDMLADGRFRKDLFYRLNVIPIQIPPLRERREDIIPLARHLLKQVVQDSGLPEVNIDPKAEKALREYEWPGNVRELLNIIERAVSTLEGNIIRRFDLPFYLYQGRKGSLRAGRPSLTGVLSRAERDAIVFALENTGYNKARAADMLGIHRTLLYKKMNKYKVSLNPDKE